MVSRHDVDPNAPPEAQRFLQLFRRYCTGRNPDIGQAAIDAYLGSEVVRDYVRDAGLQRTVIGELELPPPSWGTQHWPIRRP